jgi:hypothetical protein
MLTQGKYSEIDIPLSGLPEFTDNDVYHVSGFTRAKKPNYRSIYISMFHLMKLITMGNTTFRNMFKDRVVSKPNLSAEINGKKNYKYISLYWFMQCVFNNQKRFKASGSDILIFKREVTKCLDAYLKADFESESDDDDDDDDEPVVVVKYNEIQLSLDNIPLFVSGTKAILYKNDTDEHYYISFQFLQTALLSHLKSKQSLFYKYCEDNVPLSTWRGMNRRTSYITLRNFIKFLCENRDKLDISIDDITKFNNGISKSVVEFRIQLQGNDKGKEEEDDDAQPMEEEVVEPSSLELVQQEMVNMEARLTTLIKHSFNHMTYMSAVTSHALGDQFEKDTRTAVVEFIKQNRDTIETHMRKTASERIEKEIEEKRKRLRQELDKEWGEKKKQKLEEMTNNLRKKATRVAATVAIRKIVPPSVSQKKPAKFSFDLNELEKEARL